MRLGIDVVEGEVEATWSGKATMVERGGGGVGFGFDRRVRTTKRDIETLCDSHVTDDA